MEREPGARLGRYRLERELGRGGAAEVWAATAEDGTRVALKLLCTPAGRESQLFRRLEREGEALARLVHPNIVRFVEAFEADDLTPALVIELLEGETLKARLARADRMSPTEAANILLPMVSAVGTAHAQGIVHRDLKPANVILSPSGVKVLDFGVAKVLGDGNSSGPALTTTGTLLGTPLYMAPEQLLSGTGVDHRADVWSLGVVAYECLAGRRPFETEAPGRLLLNLLTTGVVPLASVAPDLPKALTAVVSRMLSRELEDRPEDLREVFDVLRAYATIEAPAFRRPLGGAEKTVETRRTIAASIEDELALSSRRGDLRAGDEVDARFRIEREVAAGGMGRIFRATDRLEGGSVALKVVGEASEGAADRFVREATVLAEISHPAIVRYVAHGATPRGERYLAMEWLEGEDLGQLLSRRARERSGVATAMHSRSVEATLAEGAAIPAVLPSGGPLTIDEVVILGRRAASAVAELHRRGVVHRDIKPANLFAPSGSIDQLKLLDFGTARLTAAATAVTASGVLVGTPSYMSPEQASARSDLGPQTDVWAVGCVLYEALVGHPPFEGAHLMAVLAKIVAEDPIPARRKRADVPQQLDALVLRALAKDPEARPVDGHALLEELEKITVSSRPSSAPSEPMVSSRALGGTERRVHCVLLAAERSRRVAWQELAQRLEPLGAHVSRLADGSLLVTTPGSTTPKDQAARAARIALGAVQSQPTLALSLALGQGEGLERPLGGDVIDRAAAELALAQPGQIRVDAQTAALLDARFVVEHAPSGAVLTGERAAEQTRTLLGRPSKWVGRRRELATLMGAFEESVDEGIARALLVTAPAGIGKTRLRYEFLRELEHGNGDATVLLGQGDSLSAGSPFVMIAPAIRRQAGMLDGEPLDARQEKLRARLARTVGAADLDRVTTFLGELVGVPFSDEHDDSLRAARKDPMLLGDLMRRAWEDWLVAECATAPVLLVLEDLHWGDLPSVRYVDAALSRLAERPFFVLALARPEIHETFPSLWDKRELEELRLHALSRKASTELVVQALGRSVPESTVAAIVDRSEGNAFYLEELVRTVAEGGGQALPASVLGMVHTRLDTLGSDAKRVLRACSVFGEVFWAGGVDALVGTGPGAFDAREWLDELVGREIIRRRDAARIPGETEYRFRHALVRDCAYEMLTPEDKRLGHLLAGQWLESVGELDAVVLAEHFRRGGDGPSAARWYRRAAEQALEGNDLAATIQRAERAIAAGAPEGSVGALRALQSIAAYWQSNYADGRRYGEQALTLLSAGSADWFRAAGSTIVSAARLGTYDVVDAWFDRVTAETARPDARAEQLICLARGTFQLIFAGRFERADQVLARIAVLSQESGELDALTIAQVNHVQGVRAAHIGDVGTFLTHLEAAVAAFERAGDTRNVSLERTTVAWCYAELGDFRRAERICRDNMAYCERIGAQQAVTYGKVNLGYILTGAGKLNEARRVLEEAIAECRAVNNPRLEGWARAHLTAVEHATGRHAEEEAQAHAAAELLAVSPGLRAWALATRARSKLALGDPDAALRCAREAMAILQELGGILQGESLPPLVLAKALWASGDKEGARAAIVDARERLQRRAQRLGRDDWKATFMAVSENRETEELAKTWRC